MEKLCDLLFELSHEDRHRIMHNLQEESMNVTQLSKALNLTTQECSRHLSRLSDAAVASKNAEGLYGLTPYGQLVLRELEGLQFVSQHRDYFSAHSLAHLPSEFVNRLGEIRDSTYLDNLMEAVHSVEETIERAREYLWDINLPYIASTFPLIREAFRRGIKGKFLHTRDLVVPQRMQEERRRFLGDMDISRARASKQYEERLIDQADLILYMSEREVAIILFPTQEGRYDFLGFSATDERTHKWCSDVFQYYWERATTDLA